MEEGYLADHAHANALSQAEWVEGAPEMQHWLGMKVGLKTKGHPIRKITVWRCPRCGLLEHYAL
jgi:hypothetical protein